MKISSCSLSYTLVHSLHSFSIFYSILILFLSLFLLLSVLSSCLQFLDCPDYLPSSIFQTPRSVIREPSAPPVHLDTSGVSYLSAPPPLDTSPPTHSSASLIKAIREELLRLSQKQAAVPSYHS